MIVESSNPAHSLADSKRFREAFAALDLLVVIDVTMTETARLADYVLPAASQYEKPEATFFNLEFPRNTFHLRQPLLEPLEGTLPEAEIWARLVRSLEIVDDAALEPLREAAGAGLEAYAQAFVAATTADPGLARVLPYVLYETLGPALPDGLAGAAALWGLSQRAAMTYPDAVRRAGHADGNALFEAILDGRSGVTFTLNEYEDDFALIGHADKRIALEIPELLDELRGLRDSQPGLTTAELPIVLSAGERRAYTANDIFRNPAWRKRDSDGSAAREHRRRREPRPRRRRPRPDHDGRRQRRGDGRGEPRRCSPDTRRCRTGTASTSHGPDGTTVAGVAPNSLTSSEWRDSFAGTPLHKHVPARLEPVQPMLGGERQLELPARCEHPLDRLGVDAVQRAARANPRIDPVRLRHRRRQGQP